MKPFQIHNRMIGARHPCFIIAEAGLNHNGSPELAAKLIEKAAECGADAVKFQTYTTAELFPPDHPDYKKFEKHVFPQETYERLIRHAELHRIIFLSTPFDEASADLLESLHLPAFKVGSGELTHLQFLKYLAAKKKPIILSTGMATFDQVEQAVKTIQTASDAPLALLHCVSAYPCPIDEANVRRVTTLIDHFQLPIGYSDHTEKDTAAIAAVSRGACILEKHFTLSHHLPGWDHHFSYNPDQLRQYVQLVRETEKALGSSEKKLTASELPIQEIARRSIYARLPIKTGDTFTQQNLVVRRPVGPLSADRFEKILGKKALRDLSEGSPLQLQDFEQ